MDKVWSEVDEKFVEIPHRLGGTSFREQLVRCLDDIETCTKVVEFESKSWHDAWVVRRVLVRAMWLVLTWIIKQEDKKNV